MYCTVYNVHIPVQQRIPFLASICIVHTVIRKKDTILVQAKSQSKTPGFYHNRVLQFIKIPKTYEVVI